LCRQNVVQKLKSFCFQSTIGFPSWTLRVRSQGFEVAVVKDATAAAKHPEWGYGYTAALINYAFLAHAVLRTDDVVDAMEQRKPGLAA
jgi:hypothetical protein